MSMTQAQVEGIEPIDPQRLFLRGAREEDLVGMLKFLANSWNADPTLPERIGGNNCPRQTHELIALELERQDSNVHLVGGSNWRVLAAASAVEPYRDDD